MTPRGPQHAYPRMRGAQWQHQRHKSDWQCLRKSSPLAPVPWRVALHSFYLDRALMASTPERTHSFVTMLAHLRQRLRLARAVEDHLRSTPLRLRCGVDILSFCSIHSCANTSAKLAMDATIAAVLNNPSGSLRPELSLSEQPPLFLLPF